MQNFLATWRKVPYTFSLVIWLAGLLLIGEGIGAPYIQSYILLRLTIMCIIYPAVSFMHELIYRRKSLADALITLGITFPILALGVFFSFTLFDAASRLNFLPIIVAAFVAWGVDIMVRKKARTA
ncbi:MAG: hypothetical protein OXC27_09580 [Caldilineaceae bacterium]|nr:hypothetical protein [Caldilineaceae bacterium]